jgi:hypothetical protein
MPRHKKEPSVLFGSGCYFHLWIPNFGLLAKPLYITSQCDLKESLGPFKPIKAPFNKLKETLLRAPALGFCYYSWLLVCTYTQTKTSLCVPCLRIMAMHPNCSISIKTIRLSHTRMGPLSKHPGGCRHLNI